MGRILIPNLESGGWSLLFGEFLVEYRCFGLPDTLGSAFSLTGYRFSNKKANLSRLAFLILVGPLGLEPRTKGL